MTGDGYSFSGGPWLIDHWTKGKEVKLVPNSNYWGQKPHLSSVTFVYMADPADEIAAFRSGKVQMLYPQPLPDFASLKGLPKTWLLIGGRQRIGQHPFNETLLKGDF